MACFAGQISCVKILVEHEVDWTLRDRGGSTALHWAVDGGHIAMVRHICENDCIDFEMRDNSGWTPLFRSRMSKKDNYFSSTKLIIFIFSFGQQEVHDCSSSTGSRMRREHR